MHDFDTDAEHLAQLVFQYTHERLALDPVPLDHARAPAELALDAPSPIRPEGRDARDVLHLFESVLAPAILSVDSTRFLSFIPAAPTKAALLFDMVVSAGSLQGISWLEAAGAIHAENQVLRFVADLAGLPPSAGGVFVSGGSAANLSALAVAREVAKARNGPVRHALAVSEQTHSSVANAMRILELDPLVVPAVDHRLDGDALRRAVVSSEQPVCAVVATAGSTNAGLVDDLQGVAAACAEHSIWMHVDGAYGGGALLAPSARHRFAGIEHADSFVIDPHKWLFAPYDCAALLYRDPATARAVHTQHASYLDVLHEHPDEWNPSDYAHHLTRRARGLPLWFSLAVHGTDAYRDAVERVLTIAHAAAQRIRDLPHVELVVEPELSIVVFRRVGWGDEDYARWSQRLLDDQIGFVVPTKWQSETVARLAFLHPNTTLDIVEEILATMR
jgi:glutamate/tyrosine decarboxylase-like PLP-dependent enzyme